MRKIITVLFLFLTITACDDMQVIDVMHDLTSDARSYTRTPSLDITLDIPDALKYKVPQRHQHGHTFFSDTSHTLSTRKVAMTADRIYVPTGSGETIYVFDYTGKHLPDETLTRPPLYGNLADTYEYKQSGDSLR